MATILFEGVGGYEKGGILRDAAILRKAIHVWTYLWCNIIQNILFIMAHYDYRLPLIYNV